MSRRPGPAIAFLGPSLPPGAPLPRGVVIRPPARQADVWRALEERPRALALIDGVFEHQPSVWHRELLDALAEGVPVLGAASMGALRAAELWPFGMIPVGEIARAYCDGSLNDDADVALLHADASFGFRPFTVPLVDARFAIAAALRRRLVTAPQARALARTAEALHYTDRTWAQLTRAAKVHAPGWERLLRAGPPSLKARDAARCLARLARPLPGPKPARWGPGSSFQRRSRAVATGRPVEALDPKGRARLFALAAELRIDPSKDPSGIDGLAHRLLNDGLLKPLSSR